MSIHTIIAGHHWISDSRKWTKDWFIIVIYCTILCLNVVSLTTKKVNSFVFIFSTSLHCTKSFSRISCSHALALCNLLYLISALICRPCFITACSAGRPELFSLLWSMENENDFWRQTDISIIQYSPKVSLHRRGENSFQTSTSQPPPPPGFFIFFAYVTHPKIFITILWIYPLSSRNILDSIQVKLITAKIILKYPLP